MASSALPSDDEIRSKLEEMLPTVDLASTGLKTFVKLLSAAMGVNLKEKKSFIKQALTDALVKQQQEEEEDSDPAEVSEDEDDDDDDAPPKKAKRGGGGLAAKKEISKKLQAFLKRGEHMARTEIVKALWDYIREHNLQNPANKREIFLDDAMKEVFGCETFTMFSMNKYIGAHIHPFKPVDLTSNSTPSRKRTAKASGRGSGGSSAKKARKAGTQPPYRLSEALSEVTGTDILPRPQVVSKIWDYIKAHDLQNPNDKREILCDDKLKKIFGGKSKVTMFKMNTFIGDHLIEKLDKESYQHDANSDDE
mmetsp:Transcript_5498/g.10680  ORF Transcript_5498/g.10680 Transcript_5498/m.10680 type:complete len:308 (+) Transcript_5498:174-1097(+)